MSTAREDILDQSPADADSPRVEQGLQPVSIAAGLPDALAGLLQTGDDADGSVAGTTSGFAPTDSPAALMSDAVAGVEASGPVGGAQSSKPRMSAEPGFDDSAATNTVASRNSSSAEAALVAAALVAQAKSDGVTVHAGGGHAAVTLKASGGTLDNVQTLPAPANVSARDLPLGLFSFSIRNVTPGGVATVQMTLPSNVKATGYVKQDPVTGALTPFNFDGKTGAEIRGNVVTLHYVDGARGDADGKADGIIQDPGGLFGSPFVLKEVDFATRSVVPDDQGSIELGWTFDAPQWYDADNDGLATHYLDGGDHDWPITIGRNVDLQVSKVVFRVLPDSFPTAEQLRGATITGYVDGIGAPDGMRITTVDPVQFDATNETLTFTDLWANMGFDKVAAIKSLDIQWNIDVPGWETTLGGFSDNTAYITWDTPNTLRSDLYQTLLDVGCTAAAGATSTNDVFQKVWSKFATRSINQVLAPIGTPDRALTYYGSDYRVFSQSTQSLLDKGDGQCSAWAKFFLDVLHMQGIQLNNSDYVLITPSASLSGNGATILGFAIKRWDQVQFGLGGNTIQYGFNIPPAGWQFDGSDRNWIAQHSYVWLWNMWAQGQNEDGNLPGQSEGHPASIFPNHVVVQYNDKYYDPSYGVEYDGVPGGDSPLQQFQHAAIEAFVFEKTMDLNETDVGTDLNNDGNNTDQEVSTRVMEFRPAGAFSAFGTLVVSPQNY